MESMNAWRCERCKYVGQESEFGKPGHRLCPQCKEEDDIFHYRMFECLDCGHIAPQTFWFPAEDSDTNPLESGENVLAEQCPKCPKSLYLGDGDVDESDTYPRLSVVPTPIS